MPRSPATERPGIESVWGPYSRYSNRVRPFGCGLDRRRYFSSPWMRMSIFLCQLMDSSV